MEAFHCKDAASVEAALASNAQPGGKFVAGGTTLIDLMKLNVETPARLLDINRLPLDKIEATPDGGLKIGATYAVTGAVVGEWTASSTSGLGTYLLTANSQLLTTAVYGATLLLTGIGLASFVLVTVAEHLATPWQTRSTARHWSRTARALRKAPERTTEDSLGRSGDVRLAR